MTDETVPPIFYWIKNNWFWLAVVSAALIAGASYWVNNMVLNRLTKHTQQLARFERMIDPHDLKDEKMLQTVDECRSALKPVIDNQDKLKTIIPPKAIEDGLTLQTVNGCSDARESCGINNVVEELATDIKTMLHEQTVDNKRIIKAITTLTNRIEQLTKNDRDDVLKDLIGDA